MKRLTKEQIGVIEASVQAGMKGAEIAEMMGLPRNTVYTRIRILRQKIQNSEEGMDSCKARKCFYAGSLGDGTPCCEYILITGKRRGCKAGADCTKFLRVEVSKCLKDLLV